MTLIHLQWLVIYLILNSFLFEVSEFLEIIKQERIGNVMIQAYQNS